jgi:NADH:ubiquinone oxidoreductase subunit 3 (subunit A)
MATAVTFKVLPIRHPVLDCDYLIICMFFHVIWIFLVTGMLMCNAIMANTFSPQKAERYEMLRITSGLFDRSLGTTKLMKNGHGMCKFNVFFVVYSILILQHLTLWPWNWTFK